MLSPDDEFVHPFPPGVQKTWKENWYFNFIDRAGGLWGFNHLSLVRNKGKARFTAAHVINGQPRIYSQALVIPGEFPGPENKMDDGVLSIQCLEPLRAYQVDYRGKEHRLFLRAEGRFPIYDYGKGLEDEKDQALSMEHYEQSCRMTGVLGLEGKEIRIDCLGQRDHSWGFREESEIEGWNWLAAQFEDRCINIMITRKRGKTISHGFISRASGHVQIQEAGVETRYDPDGENPKASIYTARAEGGKVIRLRAERFSQIKLPVQKGAVVWENFAEFVDLDTGQEGLGVEEHMRGG